MNCFVHPVVKPRARARLARWLCAMGLPIAMTMAATSAQAACLYKVDNQWGGGFVATIKITNTTNAPISNWTVNWQYAGDTRVANGWNATLSGTNPYSATGLNWNSAIAPNQSVEIGFQGTMSGSTAEIPVLTGNACTPATTSSSAAVSSSVSSSAASSVAVSSSTVSSNLASSSLVSSSSSLLSSSASSQSSQAPVLTNLWTLNETDSYLNFISVKSHHTVEVHRFTAMSGGIESDNNARLYIDLSTVATGFSRRDQRVRDFLFEIATYPQAVITVPVPTTLISSIAVGETLETTLTANVDLHGVVVPTNGRVSIQRLSQDRVLVQTIAPILLNAANFNLVAGLDELRRLASIDIISTAVPVDFALIFDAN